MTDGTILEFVNKYCKQDRHHDCAGKWTGFGFEVICIHNCSHWKKGPRMVEGVP
jgi:hypothetical protein